MIVLIPVDEFPGGVEVLYLLLEERTPDQSISHKDMPTFEEHKRFVENNPYQYWYLIFDKDEEEAVGSIYLTYQREIGISIFKDCRGNGYATDAIKVLKKRHPGRFLANINPKNKASITLFTEKFNARLIQETYEL